MTPSTFLAECDRRGVVLSIKPSPDGEKVAYRFPRGEKLPARFLPYLRANKPLILNLLRNEVSRDLRQPMVQEETPSRYPTDEEIDQDTELLQLAQAAEAALTQAQREREARELGEYTAMIRTAQYAAEAGIMPVETVALSKGVTVADANLWFNRAVARAKELKSQLAAETGAEQRFWIEGRMDDLNADIETVAQWYAERRR